MDSLGVALSSKSDVFGSNREAYGGSQVALKVKFSFLGILMKGSCECSHVHIIRMSDTVAHNILLTSIHYMSILL